MQAQNASGTQPTNREMLLELHPLSDGVDSLPVERKGMETDPEGIRWSVPDCESGNCAEPTLSQLCESVTVSEGCRPK